MKFLYTEYLELRYYTSCTYIGLVYILMYKMQLGFLCLIQYLQ